MSLLVRYLLVAGPSLVLLVAAIIIFVRKRRRRRRHRSARDARASRTVADDGSTPPRSATDPDVPDRRGSDDRPAGDSG